MKASRTRLEFALRAAERGWPVIPLHWVKNGKCSCGTQDCPNAGKHPLTTHGVKDATTDENQDSRMVARRAQGEYRHRDGQGSGIFVLDVDPRHGGDKSLCEAEKIHGPLPIGPRVRTGGGGEHIYFLRPAGEPLKSTVNLLPGIDCTDGRRLCRRRG